MGCLPADGSEGATAVQATAARGRRALRAVTLTVGLVAAGAVGGCSHSPLQTPVDWYHDLEGGEIAATRPPPPGADLPYPKLGTIPPKPVLPTHSYRDTVENQLAEQRDDTQRQQARNPIVVEQVPPPPVAPAAPPPPPAGQAADSPDSTTANATLPGADAPPPKPAPAAPAAPVTGVVMAGAPADAPGLVVPDAPPAPASFEGVPAMPAPTPPPPLPPHSKPLPGVGRVLFATGSAELDPSQTETLKDPMAKRGKGRIDIEGHGEAVSDSPGGQEAALRLGLKRAQAIAAKYEKMGVPADALVLSATAFGRGASVWADAPPALPKTPATNETKDDIGRHRSIPAAGLP